MRGSGGEQARLFPPDSRVEISSDEEGFKGAWYEATVLYSPSRKKNQTSSRLHVEYKTLLSDEDGSQPLREYVLASFVRPLPPPADHASGHSFELNDVVDAYHRDGWWTGVITRVLDNSRVVVTFQNPPDEIEFELSELRVHQEWVDGKWVRSGKQRIPGLLFSMGKKVEVSFDKEEYRDVWFPATVLEDFGNSFLVECQISGVDDEAGLLKVNVDYLHIRPSPPYLKDKKFILLEKVDAFYDFGWWSGVITKELVDSKYVVFFKHTNKKREMDQSELRPHMEWIDGRWVSASQDILMPPDCREQLEHASDGANSTLMDLQHEMSFDANSCHKERTSYSLYLKEANQTNQTSPHNKRISSYGTTTLKKKSKHVDHDTVVSHSQLLKFNGDERHALSPAACELINVAIQTPSPEGTAVSPLTQPMVGDQPSAKTESLSRTKKIQSKWQSVGELNNVTSTPMTKKKRQVKSQVKSPKSSQEGKAGSGVLNYAEEFVEKECITKEIDVSVVLGLECNSLRGSQPLKPHGFPEEEPLKLIIDQKQQLHGPERQKIKEINQLEGFQEINQKKRRGRPRKSLVESPSTLVTDKERNGDLVAAADEMVVEDCITSEGELPKITETGSTGVKDSLSGNEYWKGIPVRKRNSITRKDKQPNEKVVQTSSKKHEKHSPNRGRRRRLNNIEYGVQDFTAGGVGMAIDELPCTVSDDQPLSMWFEGMHAPTVEGSRVSTGKTVQQCSEATERCKDIAMQSHAVDASGDIVLSESQNLPFVKTSPLWEAIKSMEVFQVMPQNPHFRPLDSLKESSREGVAIGNMVTFSSVVQKTTELRFDDPRSTIEDSLETLFELESYGFDVKMVRDRLTELLLIKDKQEHLLDQSKELESSIMEQNHQTSKIKEEIDEIERQIKELHEKRALTISLKANKDSEIARLQSRVDDICECIKGTQLDFEGLACAPWHVDGLGGQTGSVYVGGFVDQ